MSNGGGKEHKHGLVGYIRHKSPLYKRRNKAKANARKVEAMRKFQEHFKGC